MRGGGGLVLFRPADELSSFGTESAPHPVCPMCLLRLLPPPISGHSRRTARDGCFHSIQFYPLEVGAALSDRDTYRAALVTLADTRHHMHVWRCER